jgi:hypothetical protein
MASFGTSERNLWVTSGVATVTESPASWIGHAHTLMMCSVTRSIRSTRQFSSTSGSRGVANR